jgi:hypothetical protein
VADPEVIGLFTITDLRQIHAIETRRSVANCWAALRELDFYYQKRSRYSVLFPDGSTIDTPNEPFDTLYLESLRNRAGTGFDRTDYDGLAQMCAMNLFTEVVAGLSAKKDESRVNLRQTAEGYLELTQSGHMRAFSSFGLSAFWYPKYRIAQAINRHLAIEMCDGWVGGDVQVNLIRDLVAKDWAVLLDEARNSLVGASPKAQCNLNIQATVEHAFDQGESEFLLAEESGLENFLVNFPSEQSTFGLRLSGPAGDYFVRMNNAEPLVARDLISELRSTVDRYFRAHTCAETREYVAGLIRNITQTLDQLPSELKNLSQQMEVGLAHQVHQGWWAKSVGLQKEAIEEYKRALWHALKQRVLAHVHHLRDYFSKQMLTRIQADLANLQNEVAQAEARLRVLRGKCEREKQELVGFRPSGHIVILAAGEQNSIAEDVEVEARKILKSVDRETLRKLFVSDSKPMQLLTEGSEGLLVSRMDLGFGQFSQNATASFQVSEKAVATARTRIGDLVDRAAPYVEAILSFRPLASKDIPNFLFCSNPDAARELAALANEKLDIDRYAPASSPLDHFIIFYHEAVGLALSDLAIFSAANAVLAEIEANPNRIATNYSHKRGEEVFTLATVKDFQKAVQWITCMKYLAPDSFERVGADLCLDYKTDEGLTKLLLVESAQALREYVETHGAEPLIKRFVTKLNTLGRQQIHERMEARWKQAPSVVEKEALTESHQAILKATFG